MTTRESLRRGPWPTRVLLLLVAGHLLLKLALLWRVHDVPLGGDEVQYDASARALADAVRALLTGADVHAHEAARVLVANGWFMPGMALLLLPLHLVLPDAGVELTRFYMGVITTVLFLAVVYAVSRSLGRRYAAVLLVFPGLVPMWVMFSYTSWGDLSCGLVVVLLLLWLLRGARHLREEWVPGWRYGVVLGVLCSVVLYLRSSSLPLVGGLLVVAALACLVATPRRRWLRALVAPVTAGAVFLVLLLPWSVTASKVMDAPVTTTTSVPISLAVAFGHKKDLCFGRCNGDNIWTDATGFADNISAMTGLSTVEVQKEMSAYALRDLTPQRYASGVVADLRRFLLNPSEFERKMAPARGDNAVVASVLRNSTDLAYFLFLELGAMSLVLLVRGRQKVRELSVLVSLSLAALLTQPFVHPCHGRYWPVFAPLLALAAVPVIELMARRRYPDRASRVHGLLTLAWLLTPVVLLAAAR